MANFFQVTAALLLISQTGDVKSLSIVGLGDMFIKIFGVGTFFGLNSSVETLVSQAYGAGNLHMCGVYL
jgi:Na+-driven multidrug efflux pump